MLGSWPIFRALSMDFVPKLPGSVARVSAGSRDWPGALQRRFRSPHFGMPRSDADAGNLTQNQAAGEGGSVDAAGSMTPGRYTTRGEAVFYWIYDIPTWSLAVLFSVTFVGVTWLGIVLTRPHVRRWV